MNTRRRNQTLIGTCIVGGTIAALIYAYGFSNSRQLSCDNPVLLTKILDRANSEIERTSSQFNSIPMLGVINAKFITHANTEVVSVAQISADDNTQQCKLKFRVYFDPKEVERAKEAIEADPVISRVLGSINTLDPNGAALIDAMYGDGFTLEMDYRTFLTTDGQIDYEENGVRLSND